MLHAALHEPDSYEPLLRHPIWQRALGWLRALPTDLALGRHEILGPDMFASVQEYDTVDRAVARFESHREHVDLQYTLVGEEGIDWCPRSELQPNGPFANDVQFWLPPTTPFATLVNSPGRFAIFYPGDAHRPKVNVGPVPVRKLVIKVHLNLLA
jgi:YhcH/YjgK/YiaL family protein